MHEPTNRRTFFALAGALVATSHASVRAQPEAAGHKHTPPSPHEKHEKEEDVGAVEDLMREHGVIRRVLVIYREAATRLRGKAGALPPDALRNAASLLRAFGEDYHERQLEEVSIFPALIKRGGPLAATVNTLTAQHQRGREITEYVIGVTDKSIGAQTAEPLARTLEAFARMYEAHAALEDTIVFPAWKKLLTPKGVEEMGERFEEIEHKAFGKDGFEAAVDQVGAIERSLGIELGALTAPSPPKP
jgi:hemerythrin-like domain-containing protein